MKRAISYLLAVVMLLGLLSGCKKSESEPSPSPADETVSPGTKTFVDSTGRQLELPSEITRIAVTGQMTQIALFALAGDKLVALSGEWTSEEKKYIPEEYHNLPVIGQLYGGKSEMNLESLLAVEPQLVIDIGQSKSSIVEDMNALTEQSGIPFVHIDASLATYGDMYKSLGELLGMEEAAQKLADYCESAYSTALDISAKVEKVNMLYVVGDGGLNVIVKDSFHSEVLDLLCNNLAVVDSASSKGTGNEVDMEQILTWNPDNVIFESKSVYDSVADNFAWQKVSAIETGNYFEVPKYPYNWMGFPPSVQRSLGLLWIAKLFYPNEADYDMYEQTKSYYSLFYHYDLTPEQYDELVGTSLGVRQ